MMPYFQAVNGHHICGHKHKSYLSALSCLISSKWRVTYVWFRGRKKMRSNLRT